MKRFENSTLVTPSKYLALKLLRRKFEVSNFSKAQLISSALTVLELKFLKSKLYDPSMLLRMASILKPKAKILINLLKKLSNE